MDNQKIADAMEALIKFVYLLGTKANEQKIKDWRKNHLKGKEETKTIETWCNMKVHINNLKSMFEKFTSEFNVPNNLLLMCNNFNPCTPKTTHITPKKPLTNVSNIISSHTISSTPSDNSICEAPSTSNKSPEKEVVPLVDDLKKFRDVYRKHKRLFSHMHVVKLHIECGTVPNSLARNRFPPCPFPHDQNLTNKFNEIVRACQERLLQETQNHIEESLGTVSCVMTEISVDEVTKATIRREVDWEMRDVASRALDRAEGTISSHFTPKRNNSFKRKRFNKEN